jgi:glyoxylase-like metal-dependent hydrolase (beta-lactamase superfamily II)
VEVRELAPGLWWWTGRHEEWRDDVGCVYLEASDAVCLIDPLVPPEDVDRFWRALDRDVERAGVPVHVLLTIFWHARSARAVADRYGARVWAPAGAKAAAARRLGTLSDPFRPGDPLPGGIVAHPSGRAGEVLYGIPAHRALVAGDVLLGDGNGGAKLCPDAWIGKAGRPAVRAALRPLLDLDVERLIVSHGAPVAPGGAAALRAAVEG